MPDPLPWTPLYVILSSNVDAERNLRRAVRMLRQNHHLRLRAISRVYETDAIDSAGRPVPDAPPYLDAAVALETDHYDAFSLKYNVLRFIESCLQRVRSADKVRANTLDLDLALYADQVIDTPLVRVPHPDVLRMAHVILPLAEIAPEVVHPVTGQTLAQIAAAFQGAPGVRLRPEIDLSAEE